ncbi:hypothetical protein ACFVAV_18710 [Nocardia sp. NPDC057663]|uniref:hypothetical protein n=1 Tax=Nocardia sp. NPDC057663 TaxID=3346201 RepID=UPI00366D6614
MAEKSGRKILSYRDIDQMYSGSEFPLLTSSELTEIIDFLMEHRCENIGGVVLAQEIKAPRDAIGTYRSNLIDRRNDTFKGPNILGGTYYPNGVGIWTTGDIGDIR